MERDLTICTCTFRETTEPAEHDAVCKYRLRYDELEVKVSFPLAEALLLHGALEASLLAGSVQATHVEAAKHVCACLEDTAEALVQRLPGGYSPQTDLTVSASDWLLKQVAIRAVPSLDSTEVHMPMSEDMLTIAAFVATTTRIEMEGMEQHIENLRKRMQGAMGFAAKLRAGDASVFEQSPVEKSNVQET